MPLSQFDRENVRPILEGHGGWFTAQLMRLVLKADNGNRSRLAKGFPEEVRLVEQAWGLTPILGSRAEPEEEYCHPHAADLGCPCYEEGANEGHSMGCNDDSCACWAAGYEAGAEVQPETLLREAGQARREEGERVRDGK